MKKIDEYIKYKNENMSYANGLYFRETNIENIINEQISLHKKVNKDFVENNLNGFKNESK